MSSHVFRLPSKQPATRFRDPHLPVPESDQWIDQKPRALRRCHVCHKLRQCRHLHVQVAYDTTRYTCADTDCQATLKARARKRRRNAQKHSFLK